MSIKKNSKSQSLTPKQRNLRDWLEEQKANDPDLIAYPEFIDALIGEVTRCGMPTVLCYDFHLMVKVCMRQGMDHESAVEHICFNYEGGYIGEKTPFILHKPLW